MYFLFVIDDHSLGASGPPASKVFNSLEIVKAAIEYFIKQRQKEHEFAARNKKQIETDRFCLITTSQSMQERRLLHFEMPTERLFLPTVPNKLSDEKLSFESFLNVVKRLNPPASPTRHKVRKNKKKAKQQKAQSYEYNSLQEALTYSFHLSRLIRIAADKEAAFGRGRWVGISVPICIILFTTSASASEQLSLFSSQTALKFCPTSAAIKLLPYEGPFRWDFRLIAFNLQETPLRFSEYLAKLSPLIFNGCNSIESVFSKIDELFSSLSEKGVLIELRHKTQTAQEKSGVSHDLASEIPAQLKKAVVRFISQSEKEARWPFPEDFIKGVSKRKDIPAYSLQLLETAPYMVPGFPSDVYLVPSNPISYLDLDKRHTYQISYRIKKRRKFDEIPFGILKYQEENWFAFIYPVYLPKVMSLIGEAKGYYFPESTKLNEKVEDFFKTTLPQYLHYPLIMTFTGMGLAGLVSKYRTGAFVAKVNNTEALLAKEAALEELLQVYKAVGNVKLILADTDRLTRLQTPAIFQSITAGLFKARESITSLLELPASSLQKATDVISDLLNESIQLGKDSSIAMILTERQKNHIDVQLMGLYEKEMKSIPRLRNPNFNGTELSETEAIDRYFQFKSPYEKTSSHVKSTGKKERMSGHLNVLSRLLLCIKTPGRNSMI